MRRRSRQGILFSRRRADVGSDASRRLSWYRSRNLVGYASCSRRMGSDAQGGGGEIVNPIGTCCCSSVGGPCCECSSYPNQYTIAVSGVTNEFCTVCTSKFNTTFTLTKASGTVCKWLSPAFASVSECVVWDPPMYWDLNCGGAACTSGTTSAWCLTLQANGELALYTQITVWSCLGTNVMSVVSFLPGCTTPPTSITLVPV